MNIKIFHTNDIHSNFDSLIDINTYIKDNKTNSDFLFDIGDLCDLKSTLVQGTDGLGARELIEKMGYDAQCVGNNEIDMEYEKLNKYSMGRLPVLSANLTDNDGKRVGNIAPGIIITKNNVRFLIIGVSPYYGLGLVPGVYNVFYNMGNLNVSDPIYAVKEELAKHKGQYDISIVLSHCGIETEVKMANALWGIDILLGGHSHTEVISPFKINNTIYAQAGMFANYLGELDIEIEDTDKRIIGFSGRLIKNEFEKDEELLAIYKEQNEKAIAALSKTIYSIEKLEWSATEENELTNFICDALYMEHECDLSFINSGIVNGPVEGDISKMKLLELSPSKLNPTKVPLAGKKIREAIKKSLDKEFVMQSGRGAGFRGNVLGTLCFSHNVQILVKPLTVTINNQPLDDNRIYVCMTNDYLQRGTCYNSLKTQNKYCTFYNGFIRDLLERNLQNEQLREQCRIKRIKNKNRNLGE